MMDWAARRSTRTDADGDAAAAADSRRPPRHPCRGSSRWVYPKKIELLIKLLLHSVKNWKSKLEKWMGSLVCKTGQLNHIVEPFFWQKCCEIDAEMIAFSEKYSQK